MPKIPFNLLQKNNAGQTLIETVVALFILVMGISAAVGLSVFAYASSSNISKQIIATGLAREGIEAVKSMRDTNWLRGTLEADNCYNYETGEADKAACYPTWLDQVYCINPTNNQGNCNGDLVTGNYVLDFSTANANFWTLRRVNSTNYGLTFYNPTTTNTWRARGFYSPGSIGGISCATAAGRSDYCRKIILTKDATAPFNQDVGPQLIVRSQVWWVDKKCPRVSDYANAKPTCRLELTTYLTNWKNFSL